MIRALTVTSTEAARVCLFQVHRLTGPRDHLDPWQSSTSHMSSVLNDSELFVIAAIRFDAVQGAATA